VQLATEQQICDSYRGRNTATRYVAERFSSELGRFLHHTQAAVINDALRREGPRATLEIAPGPGRLTRDVIVSGELTCLEYNDGMIEEGRRNCHRKVRWVQGNAFALPFTDEAFDFVYTFRFIRHFHRDDRDRLYNQISRVLRPGGVLVFDAVNSRVSAPLRQAAPDDYPIYDKLYRDQQELTTELCEAGFAVEKLIPVQRWYSMQSRVQNLLAPRNRMLCRWALSLLERLRRGPALEWIVLCRRLGESH
jgi:SAM-dependent methyltransferase